jgi:hypothetical protein
MKQSHRRQRLLRFARNDASAELNAIRAVFICMSPISDTAQAERNEVKSKLAPLRLRRRRGYAQGERESNQGYAQVQTALVGQRAEPILPSPLFSSQRWHDVLGEQL